MLNQDLIYIELYWKKKKQILLKKQFGSKKFLVLTEALKSCMQWWSTSATLYSRYKYIFNPFVGNYITMHIFSLSWFNKGGLNLLWIVFIGCNLLILLSMPSFDDARLELCVSSSSLTFADGLWGYSPTESWSVRNHVLYSHVLTDPVSRSCWRSTNFNAYA